MHFEIPKFPVVMRQLVGNRKFDRLALAGV